MYFYCIQEYSPVIVE